jgi:hypothetical protein
MRTMLRRTWTQSQTWLFWRTISMSRSCLSSSSRRTSLLLGTDFLSLVSKAFRASASSARLPSRPPLPTRAHSNPVAILLPGLVWSLGKTRPAERTGSAAYQSKEIDISGACSLSERRPSCARLDCIHGSIPGSRSCKETGQSRRNRRRQQDRAHRLAPYKRGGHITCTRVLHPMPCHRFDARTRRRSPVR